jgi:hypothetical protein
MGDGSQRGVGVVVGLRGVGVKVSEGTGDGDGAGDFGVDVSGTTDGLSVGGCVWIAVAVLVGDGV